MLGRRTAELHRALGFDPDDPDFAPQPISTSDVHDVVEEARAQVRASLDALRDRVGDLSGPVADDARYVLDHAPLLEAGLREFESLAPSGSKQRVHGDYHLGQVLRTEDDDFLILDFEGEPLKPLARRRARQSPLKDVVGMLRSFDYAAFGALFAVGEKDANAAERLRDAVIAFRDSAATAFCDAYRTTAAGAFLPSDDRSVAAWLNALTLDKTLYELLYELNQRPDWVRIPLQGVRALVERAAGPEGGSRP
jgi:maltose alpha-D-glucosyltransferase/alpha-amylase